MAWHENGTTIADPEQVVLESDPYRRLSYSWHTFTPEWAANNDLADDHVAKLRAEPRSTVTFQLEQDGPVVKLTVVHEGGPTLLADISQGWPAILSNLKSLLESGDVLPTA